MADALRGRLDALIAHWNKAELDMRVLHGGSPGSGYDKLADGYGTCADELRAELNALRPPEQGVWCCEVCGNRLIESGIPCVRCLKEHE